MTPVEADNAMRAAMAAHKAERFDEAEAGYRGVLSARPADPKAFYYLGLLSFHRGDTTTAIAHMRECLRFAPNHPHAWNALGGMLIAQGARDEATRAYRRVTETAPGMGEGWYNLGICLRDAGDIDGAIACLRTSIARQPDFAKSFDALGTLLYQLGRVEEAARAYEEWAAREPANAVAQHMAAATSQRQVPTRAADEYVRMLFDDSAASFDDRLERLGYRAPELIAAALAGESHRDPYTDVLDAGCGTGLCGPLLRPHARRLWGIDLSPNMLERARARGCYDELALAELTAFMRSRPDQFDAIVSADTLVYFGDLLEPLRAARHALRQGGLLMFTLETSAAGKTSGYTLEAHGRYSHREDYVGHCVSESGFDTASVSPAVLRSEGEQDVQGMLVKARVRAGAGHM